MNAHVKSQIYRSQDGKTAHIRKEDIKGMSFSDAVKEATKILKSEGFELQNKTRVIAEFSKS